MRYLFLAAALLVGCQTQNLDADGLPPATQTGANTGGFLLDGQPFVPSIKRKLTQASANAYRPTAAGRLFVIRLSQDDSATPRPVGRHLEVALDSVTGPGRYRATESVDPRNVGIYGSRIHYWVQTDRPTDFVTGPTSPGLITITRLDTVAHIIAGTFEAELREHRGPGAHRISKGRFDCVYTVSYY